MMPESVRATLLSALHEYHGSGKRAAIVWVELEPLERVSTREQEVVRLVAQGMTNKEIAAELGIEDKSVRSHLHNIFSKLNATNRTQVALWFVRQSVMVTIDDEPEEGS